MGCSSSAAVTSGAVICSTTAMRVNMLTCWCTWHRWTSLLTGASTIRHRRSSAELALAYRAGDHLHRSLRQYHQSHRRHLRLSHAPHLPLPHQPLKCRHHNRHSSVSLQHGAVPTLKGCGVAILWHSMCVLNIFARAPKAYAHACGRKRSASLAMCN